MEALLLAAINKLHKDERISDEAKGKAKEDILSNDATYMTLWKEFEEKLLTVIHKESPKQPNVSPQEPVPTFKVLIVGFGGVGKTTFVKTLVINIDSPKETK